MKNDHGRWNDPVYYPYVNRIKYDLEEDNTEKLLYEECLELRVQNFYNQKDLCLAKLETTILERVAASYGLTRGQLEKYLLMMGVDHMEESLSRALFILTKYGYLAMITVNQAGDNLKITLYDITDKGIEYLKNSNLPYRNMTRDLWECKDVFRYIRKIIIANQIVLNILSSNENIRSFCFNRKIRIYGDDGLGKNFLFPLYVQSSNRNYHFLIIGNTHEGKQRFDEFMESLIEVKGHLPSKTTLVIVAETYAHMRAMTIYMKQYEERGLLFDTLFTHDSVWYYTSPAKFYAEANAMGQTGLLSVKLL